MAVTKLQFKDDLYQGLPTLSEQTTLWRYVGLSALLQMLDGWVFIPKISTFQSEDPNESWVTTQGNPSSWAERTELAHESNCGWLSGKAEQWEATIIEQYRQSKGIQECRFKQGLLESIWLRELAKRRCAWCWFQSEGECMAQWRIYARDGVAIKSNANRVLKSLRDVGDLVYGRMAYLPRNGTGRLFDQYPDLKWHPYFAKQAAYKHENEVRFVFRDDEVKLPGRLVKLTFSDLVEEIVVSPFLPDSEGTAAMNLIRKLLGEKSSIQVNVSAERASESWRRDGPTHDERWQKEGPGMNIRIDELPPAMQLGGGAIQHDRGSEPPST